MRISPLLAIGAAVSLVSGITVEKGSLRVNGAVDSISVDTATPRISWWLASDKRADNQTAYQIQASSSKSDFNTPDLWDTGKVASSSLFATYDGKKIASRSVVYWRVKVWDVDGDESDWSEVAVFEVSLLSTSDWKASWITNENFATGNTSLPTFAKPFRVTCPVAKARLYMLGLGLHVTSLNEKPVDDSVLAPGYSTVSKTLPYSTYDVTEQLQNGKNLLEVELGKGVYDAEKPLLGRYTKFKLDTPVPLMLIAQLEYTCENGETKALYSDESWLTTVSGPYWETSWYGGEEYDARKEISGWAGVCANRKNWSKATIATPPTGALVSPRAPPLKVTETLKAVAVNQVGSEWVFDFGINIAGTFQLTMSGKGLEGTRIVFKPGENITDSGGISQSTTGSPIFDAYTLSDAESQSYSPKFLYHGFRYVSVNVTWTPSLSDMTAYVIRAANEPVLSLQTSNELFNSIHKIIDRSIQGNMYSVLTDCPHREKLGWLEQNQFVFHPLAMGYDLESYGRDMVLMMADAQASDIPGLIPDIAPELGNPMGGGYRNDPNWGNAMTIVPLRLYQYYGDIDILRYKHQFMVEYVEYLVNRAGGAPYLLDGGLGDWESLDTTTPKAVAVSFGYFQAVKAMVEVEEILGNTAEAAYYRNLSSTLQAGFHSMWFNTTGSPHYCTNSQACNALALDLGAVPEEYQDDVLKNLLDSLESHDWHITVGEVGLPSVYKVLHAAGRDDVLFKLMNTVTSPGYGYQVQQGATSLWEHWDADDTGGSLNHFMFGYGDTWLLGLSGLVQKEGSVGWREIEYKPVVVGDLTSVSMTYRTPIGPASASWTVKGGTITYDITVPVGAVATVTFPAVSAKENAKEMKAASGGIMSIEEGKSATVIKAGSGTYSFSGTLVQ